MPLAPSVRYFMAGRVFYNRGPDSATFRGSRKCTEVHAGLGAGSRSVLDKRGGRGDNQSMPDARPLFLVLALEAAPMGAVRLMRSSGQKSAYVATLVVEPDDYQPVGLIETGSGVDVFWSYRGNPRLAGS